ncbi:hypothetical protein ABAC402_09700 [Asticcacaulis sp. AC402]|nr:hypothetical protein ABAC402_09700 [Asticcacaulis sp. AC402]
MASIKALFIIIYPCILIGRSRPWPAPGFIGIKKRQNCFAQTYWDQTYWDQNSWDQNSWETKTKSAPCLLIGAESAKSRIEFQGKKALSAIIVKGPAAGANIVATQQKSIL